jgi:hypothetical protein
MLPDAAHLREIKEKLGGKLHALAVFPYDSEVTGPAAWQAMLDGLSPLRGALKVYSQEVNGGNRNLLRGLADAAFCNVAKPIRIRSSTSNRKPPRTRPVVRVPQGPGGRLGSAKSIAVALLPFAPRK